jgi:hypothetical protein
VRAARVEDKVLREREIERESARAACVEDKVFRKRESE